MSFGPVDEGKGLAPETIAKRYRPFELHGLGFGPATGSNQLDDLRAGLDQLGVVASNIFDERAVVAGDELGAVKIVGKLVELAQRCVELARIGSEQRGGEGVELLGGVVLELPIGGYLLLQIDQLGGALVRATQDQQPDRAKGDEHDNDAQDGHQQLGLDAGRDAGNQPRQPVHHGAVADAARSCRSCSSSFGSKRSPMYCTRSRPWRSTREVSRL